MDTALEQSLLDLVKKARNNARVDRWDYRGDRADALEEMADNIIKALHAHGYQAAICGPVSRGMSHTRRTLPFHYSPSVV